MNTEKETLSTEEKNISLGKQGTLRVSGHFLVHFNKLIECDPDCDCHPEGCERCFLESYADDFSVIDFKLDESDSFLKVELVKEE